VDWKVLKCSTFVHRNGVVLGLSKVARLAKMFARRLQNQHRFTQQLLEAFNAEVQPLGCSAIVEARQLGREQCTGTTVTGSTLGCFYAQPEIYLQVRSRLTQLCFLYSPIHSSRARQVELSEARRLG